MYPHLKSGYAVRHPTEDDIPAIIQLIHAFDLAETGEADMYEPEDIRNDWRPLNPELDAWLVYPPAGQLCGYATLTYTSDNGRLLADGYVHPEQYGRGIGTTLVTLMEVRAQEIIATVPQGQRLVLINNVLITSDASRALLETRDYTLTRVFFRMHITLDMPPPEPIWPQGISIRACDGSPEDIRRAYETIEDAFRDHWAHTPESYEEWQRHMLRDPFDPTLWFLAQDGDEIVGAALSRVQEEGRGWLARLGVRRAWRKRGLGLAFLHQTFSTFYQRGMPRVGLAVDGQSLTGAQRLYEQAGMHITMRIGRYEKELRPGEDLLKY